MEFSLAAGDLLRIKGNRNGGVLHCLKGTVWVTTGDGVDYLVRSGERFGICAGAAPVVEGLGEAEIRLEALGCERAGSRSILILSAAVL